MTEAAKETLPTESAATEAEKKSETIGEPVAIEGEEELKEDKSEKDIASLDSVEEEEEYGEEMFGEQFPIEISEEEDHAQVFELDFEFEFDEEEQEEGDEDKEVDVAQKVEVNRIEIPNLYEFMESCSELYEEVSKKKIGAAPPKKTIRLPGEEMGEEECLEDLDEEQPEAYENAADLEKKERSDVEMFMLFEEVEEKSKPSGKKKKDDEEVDILQASGVKDFLDTIIDEAVTKSETVDPDTVLRIKLDRAKLARAFNINISELRDENRKRNWLHKKVVDFFRKKKYTRALTEENIETLPDNLRRYREVLRLLDKTMAREDTSRIQLQKRVEDLKDTEEELRLESKRKFEDVYKRLKEVALSSVSIKTGQPMPERLVDILLRKMNFLWTQISQLRLTFIKAQHRIALLQNETRRLEDIGAGLKMMDYETLRAETQELEDKLEERNTELSKIRERCTADAHLLCHIREKQFMLNCIISKQDRMLRALKRELNENRTYLSELKLERDKKRKKHSEMSYQCGLLDKNHLLYDYDATIEKISQTEASVENLKKNKRHYLDQLKIISKELGRTE